MATKKVKREPSIHITKTQFLELWKKVDYPISEEFVIKFFMMARKYSLDHRSVLPNTKKQIQNVSSRTTSTVGDANLLADTIYSIRIKLKHVGVTKIKQTDSQWAWIKQLVSVVNDFCNNFNLKKRQGYIAFVETAIDLLTSSTKRANYNFIAKWMLDKNNWIIDRYQAKVDLTNDPYPQETQYIHNRYCNIVLDKTGILNNYIKDPSLYIHFLRAREEADSRKVDYDTYIDAQFEALSFCNGIPKIEDLYGEKATQRLISYVSKYNIQLNQENVDEDIWKQFKH